LNRIRNNQRRSRARQKEYIEDLEKRVRAFESLGAQAGVELQATAQKVAIENSLLRALLGQYGVTPVEVETYLNGRCTDSNISSFAPASYPPRRPPLSDLVKPADSNNHTTTVGKPRDPTQVLQTARSVTSAVWASHIEPVALEHIVMPLSPKMSQELPLQQPLEKPPPILDHHQPLQACDSEEPPRGGSVDDATTSCETAAWIIANMRGHGRLEEVRAELGCPSSKDCKVENLAIFEAMDH
jgi:hypothetical protein